MEPCGRCGARNPEGFRFCGACGAPLAGTVRGHGDVRKTVTILFVDVVGSTALGERVDPEAARRLMTRYFAMAKAIIEGHGGTVEKFVGDAVMAVFGYPAVHEDDALRAVRAAAEILPALAALDEGDRAGTAAPLEVRIGINTGEVIAGDPASDQAFVTGDAVNTAARIEQASRPSEILLGEPTYRLIRDAVEVEPARTIDAKGKSLPIAAHRLLAVLPGAPAHARSFDVPLVGRERELRRLQQAYEDVVSEPRGELFTLLGMAGVGKSRLVAEFLAWAAPGAVALRGRCLPYGEGITYWPVAEVVRAAAGITEADQTQVALAKLQGLLTGADPAVGAGLASAIGWSDAPTQREEIFWAFRRFLEHLASDRPLIVVFEDIHWAEPTFLEAIEHVADLSRGVPILLVCPARPELLDARPDWPDGKLKATTLLLEPLPVEAADRLISALPGGPALPAALRGRITDAAEGNPLFVEEMLRMLVEDGVLVAGDGGWTMERQIESVAIPATIQALLAARLDQLFPRDRTIATRASVVGRVFEQEAVSELAPDELRDEVASSLVALVRQELIRPERATLSRGDAYKFRHILIRDAAYESLPKIERAELHERFADWLERVAGDRLAEYEAILGYHLGQAHHYRQDIGLADGRSANLAARAGQHLANAGRDASDRGDLHAASELLSRAIALLPEGHAEYWPARMALGPVLYLSGALNRSAVVLDEVIEATRSADPALSAEARLHRATVEDIRRQLSVEEWERTMAPVLRALQRGKRWRACTEVWQAIGVAYQNDVEVRRASRAYQRAARYARRLPDSRVEIGVLLSSAALATRSRVPVRQAIAMVNAAIAVGQPARLQHSFASLELAYLAALEGRYDDARASLSEDREIRSELGRSVTQWSLAAGVGETFAQDWRAAEQHFRSAYDAAKSAEPGFVPFLAARLAQALQRLGRNEEAASMLGETEAESGAGSQWATVLAQGTRARLLARQGRHDEAVALAREVVASAAAAGFEEYPVLWGGCLQDLAAVLVEIGRHDEAREALTAAAQAYDEKGALALASQVRRELASLDRPAQAAHPG